MNPGAPRSSPAPRPPRCVHIYVRPRAGAKNAKTSTAYQRRQLEEEAHRQGWTVDGVYVDETRTGVAGKLPARDRVLTRARARGGILLAWSLDLLVDDLHGALRLLHELGKARVGLVCVQGQLDTRTPQGRALTAAAAPLLDLDAALARERQEAALRRGEGDAPRGGAPRVALSPEQALAAVAEYGGVRKAARALKVSPSLVSRRAKAAREARGRETWMSRRPGHPARRAG